MNLNLEGNARVDDFACHVDVGAGERRVTRRVVVHQDQTGRRQLQRTPGDLALIDRRMVDVCPGSSPHRQSADFFHRGKARGTVRAFRAASRGGHVPAGQTRTRSPRACGFPEDWRGSAVRQRLSDRRQRSHRSHLPRRDRQLAQQGHRRDCQISLPAPWRWLHVPPGEEGYQQDFENLICVERRGPARQQLATQALAMALPVRFVCSGFHP